MVYTPHSDSPKQRLYWARLPVRDKLFLRPTRMKRGEVLNQTLLALRVGSELRHRSFDEFFAGSLADIHTSYIVSRISHGSLYTFDDGSFNINVNNFNRLMLNEAFTRRIARKLLGLPSNREVVNQASAHFTVFSPELNITPAKRFVKISLLDSSLSSGKNRFLRIMLGSPDIPKLVDSKIVRLKRQIVNALPWDLYLPHPLEKRLPEWRVKVDVELEQAAEQLIAEEVISLLSERGYECSLVGFDSTTLFILADECDVSTVLSPLSPLSNFDLAIRMGVRTFSFDDILSGKTPWS